MPIVGQFGSLAGLGSLILPGGAMESIATVTVGSGGASSIEFTSIPGTYQHLQIRMMGRSERSSSVVWDDANVTVNGDTGTNYARHILFGGGASAAASGAGGQSNMNFFSAFGSNFSGTWVGGMILDVLDYGSTSKTKTFRFFGGMDANGTSQGGQVSVASGLWNSTSAITSIRIVTATGSNIAQHSTAALYGIKAP